VDDDVLQREHPFEYGNANCPQHIVGVRSAVGVDDVWKVVDKLALALISALGLGKAYRYL
jgi:hypothetical protein